MLVSLVLWRRTRSHETGVVTAGANPFEFGEAIKFGLLFGVVTVVAKAAEVYLGETGLYLAGAVAGLTDVDAISLSMANLATANPESLKVAARTIVIAVLSNTLVKTGMASVFGRACSASYPLAGHVSVVDRGGGGDYSRGPRQLGFMPNQVRSSNSERQLWAN